MSASDPVPGRLGPLCPSCRKPLHETLRVGSLDAMHEDDGSDRRVDVTFCGACGTGLSAVPSVRSPRHLGISRRRNFEVPDPDDPESLEGRFQLRCRELIGEIEQVGFMPGGWISLIMRHGAAGAARELLGAGRVLPVTPWLVAQGRQDLTMEREITRPEWSELFDETDRVEAERRLGIASEDD
jgi:hypothetical protein